MDILKHNSKAWDHEVMRGNPWTQPVSTQEITQARLNNFRIVLTPTKAVPRHWINPVKDKRILCLASGGGQQGPLLAAAGARVTVLDASEKQLERDNSVATREGLSLETVPGDMADLSCFQGNTFDLIVHPVSNCFVPKITPVWQECFRVLRPSGALLSGFSNPIIYSLDRGLFDRGIFQLKHRIPYSDEESLTSEELQKFVENSKPLEFGHSLEDQIGGQLNAGFVLRGLYEDLWGNGEVEDKYFPSFMATWATKP
jgi:ubiquinone/menaquinone biosynthesis C-methylase UbiE